MNRTTSNRTLVVNLDCYSIVTDRLSALTCRRCRHPLDIHQPDPNQPDQFLGTCPGCSRWYRVQWMEGNGQVTVLLLPQIETIQVTTTADQNGSS